MKKTIFSLFAIIALFAFTSCDDYETYGEKKEKEREAIAAYIADNNIKVIDEATFVANGEKTSVADNEYVYLDKSGVYMQNKQVNILCRFIEYNINEGYEQLANMYSANYPEKFTVMRTGSTLTGSFTQGYMQNAYNSTSVPEGWLVPLLYINIGRQTSADEEIAKVKLIVPHSKGQAYAQQSVYACHYIITYQRER